MGTEITKIINQKLEVLPKNRDSGKQHIIRKKSGLNTLFTYFKPADSFFFLFVLSCSEFCPFILHLETYLFAQTKLYLISFLPQVLRVSFTIVVLTSELLYSLYFKFEFCTISPLVELNLYYF